MANCPNCKQKIPWYKFIFSIWLYNPKQYITCGKCKTVSKTEKWMIFTPLMYALWLSFGGIFYYLDKLNEDLGIVLFPAWFLFMAFSPVFLMGAPRNKIM